MKKKKNIKNENSLESELIKLIKPIVNDCDRKLNESEIKEVVSEIMPEIDKLIANKVIQHFKELANYVIKNFSTGDS